MHELIKIKTRKIDWHREPRGGFTVTVPTLLVALPTAKIAMKRYTWLNKLQNYI